MWKTFDKIFSLNNILFQKINMQFKIQTCRNGSRNKSKNILNIYAVSTSSHTYIVGKHTFFYKHVCYINYDFLLYTIIDSLDWIIMLWQTPSVKINKRQVIEIFWIFFIYLNIVRNIWIFELTIDKYPEIDKNWSFIFCKIKFKKIKF